MADNRKETKENQTRWIFRDSMVEDLIEALEASKTEYEYRGLDFGPVAVSEPTKSIEEISLKRGMSARRRTGVILSFFLAFSCVYFSSAPFNNKRHNEADHKRKIGSSCMFHVNIYADLKSRTGLM